MPFFIQQTELLLLSQLSLWDTLILPLKGVLNVMRKKSEWLAHNIKSTEWDIVRSFILNYIMNTIWPITYTQAKGKSRTDKTIFSGDTSCEREINDCNKIGVFVRIMTTYFPLWSSVTQSRLCSYVNTHWNDMYRTSW